MSSTTGTSRLRESVKLGISKRTDFTLRRDKVALIVVDVQRYCCNGQTAYYQNEALPRMLTNIQQLLQVFRLYRDSLAEQRNGCEVLFTAIQSLTMDVLERNKELKE